MKDVLSELNVNVASLVRSGVVLVLGVPVILALGNAFNASAVATREETKPSVRDLVIDSYQGDAAEACVKFLVSKSDSKLEREAKTELDDLFGGDVNHAEVCKWVFS